MIKKTLYDYITNFKNNIFGAKKPHVWFEENLGSINEISFLSQECNDDKYAIAFFQAFDIYLKENKLDEIYPFTYLKIKERLCTLSLRQENIELFIEVDTKYGFKYLYPDILILDWLLICLKSSSNSEIKFYFDKFSNNVDHALNINPEEQIRKILFKNHIIRNEFKPNNNWHIYIDNIIQWFVERYDFETAKLIIKQISKLEKETVNEKNDNEIHVEQKEMDEDEINNKKKKSINFSRGYIIIVFILLITSSLFSLNKFVGFSSIPFARSGILNELRDAQTITSFNQTPVLNYYSLEFILELVSILFFIYSIIRIFRERHYIYLKSPRLFIGIIVGYLPLFSFLTLALKISVLVQYLPVITAIILSFIIYLYLRYEVTKVIGREDKVEITKRTLRMFIQGLNYSLFIGLIIIDLFSLTYAKLIVAFPRRMHIGIIGIIDPMLLLFFFPVALFLGVVVQFIWEEKPITHPIK